MRFEIKIHVLCTLRTMFKGGRCTMGKKQLNFLKSLAVFDHAGTKAELLQLNRTQFPFLGIFVCKKVGNPKN